MSRSENKFMVSVRLMTYNHSAFIDQAMEGILQQRTSFKFEVVVGDDFSTDGTLDIIRKYRNKDNVEIRILERKQFDSYWEKRQVLGRLYNFADILHHCGGKYIALLDGDDYWVDPEKLQKQVDFLESNPEFFLCGHQSFELKDDLKSGNILGQFQRDCFGYEDVATSNVRIPTASIMFRNSLMIPSWFYQIYGGDRAVIFMSSKQGLIKIMDFTGSVYRIHSGGVESDFSKNKSAKATRNIREYKVYASIVEPRLRLPIFRKIMWNYFYLGISSLRSLRVLSSIKPFSGFFIYTIKSIKCALS